MMGKAFANQILAGNFTIDDVPGQWYDDCVAALREKAASGEITQERLASIVTEE